MESLHTLVTTLLTSHSNWKIQLMVNWATIVGAMGQHICLEKIVEDSTLIVGVHDTRWMQELHYLSYELIDLINRGLGGSFVQTIRFVLSRRLKVAVRHPRKITTPQQPQKQVVRSRRPLNNKQMGALQAITDRELQDCLRDLMQMSV